MGRLAAVVIASACIGAAFADAPLDLGESLLDADPFTAFEKPEGVIETASVEVVEVAGQTFERALRLISPGGGGFRDRLRITAPTAAPVEKGEVLWASFSYRSVGGGDASVNVSFSPIDSFRERSLSRRVEPVSEWNRIDLPFRSRASYDVGDARITFFLGSDPQTIEIGGLQLLNFKDRVAMSDLPSTPIVYDGHEPDAAWRAEAHERIERIRKADMTVRVTDENGEPVEGATVNASLKRHGFPFGTTVAAWTAFPDEESADTGRYRMTITELFGAAVIENALKWPFWERESTREQAMKTLEWLKLEGIPLRGHTLVWPSWNNTPDHLEDLKDRPDALRNAVLDHIKDEVTATRGYVVDWDVINEPYTNHDLIDILGESEMVEWFKAAHEADPDAKLYLNDFGILSGRGENTEHQAHFEKTIRFLIDNGAPIHGVGMQGHFSENGLRGPVGILEVLDRYAEFGLPIKVTELDISTTDTDLQARYLRDALTALFSHPAVEGVLIWGFWEARHWRPDAALFYSDWTIKPVGELWKRLVHEEWKTRVKGSTNANGEFTFRGFVGDYTIAATRDENAMAGEATLPKRGAEIDIRIQ